VTYILAMALRINWNTARYQKMSDMRVGLFLMGFRLVTLGKKLTPELSDELGNDKRKS
jgi:hypothetical protein